MKYNDKRIEYETSAALTQGWSTAIFAYFAKHFTKATISVRILARASTAELSLSLCPPYDDALNLVYSAISSVMYFTSNRSTARHIAVTILSLNEKEEEEGEEGDGPLIDSPCSTDINHGSDRRVSR